MNVIKRQVFIDFGLANAQVIYIGEAHTQFRRYSRNQQTAPGVFTIRLEEKSEQGAMVNAWTYKMWAN